MDIVEITDFLKILSELPTGWKITFAVVFVLIPKLIQILGGGKVVRFYLQNLFKFIAEVIRRYQTRLERRAEDEGLTEAYTRTLVIESLGLFAERLKRADHKINHILLILDKGADIEIIEATPPERKYSDTVIHKKLTDRLAELRRRKEKDG